MKHLIDGLIKEKTHFYYIRVHYEDTDIGGIVYHAKYINFIERARTSLIRLIKFPAEKFLENDNFFQGKVKAYMMDSLHSVDIDFQIDLDWAEFLLANHYINI